jgi:LysM repeat protein
MTSIKGMALVIIFLFFPLISPLSAETQEYKDYTVIKGDTLWDISQKELGDPFLWPKIWKENTGIANPDRIYPGQKIRIPLYLLQKEIPLTQIPETKIEKKEPKIEIAKKIEPIKKEYLVSKDILMASGYIADSVHGVGSIVDSSYGRKILGKGDYAYIKTDNSVKIGDKFYIIRSLGTVTHPKSGKLLGYLIEVPGIAEVVDQYDNETKVQIIDSFVDVNIGDLLASYYEIEPPFLTEEKPRKLSINGYIVAAKELRVLTGKWDIVYIDKGESEGLKVGDLFTIIQGNHKEERGVIQIINLRKSTATAIIRESRDEIARGDEVKGFR